MIPVTRENLLIVGIIVCLVGLIFMFKELGKTKEDVDNFKNFSEQVVKHLNTAPEPVKIEEQTETEEVGEKVEE
jgi:hypothetical protein